MDLHGHQCQVYTFPVLLPPVTTTAPSAPATLTAPSPPPAPSPPVTTAPALADNAHISHDEWEKALISDAIWKNVIWSGKKGWEVMNTGPSFRTKIYLSHE